MRAFYAIIFALAGVSVAWLGVESFWSSEYTVCLFKNATGFPCPSCGSTRAIVLLLDGDIAGSLLLNPVGVILAFSVLIVVPWSVADVLRHTESLYRISLRCDRWLSKHRAVLSVGALLILANWAWNISKHL